MTCWCTAKWDGCFWDGCSAFWVFPFYSHVSDEQSEKLTRAGKPRVDYLNDYTKLSTDISCHLNTLNLQVQGTDKQISAIWAFQNKLTALFISDKELVHFPKLRAVTTNDHFCSTSVTVLEELTGHSAMWWSIRIFIISLRDPIKAELRAAVGVWCQNQTS